MQIRSTKEQQGHYAQRFNDELEKMTMSWSSQLKEWYPLAIKALDFANAHTINIAVDKYPLLFKTDSYGINMNVVALLCNNLELRTPAEMGVSAMRWAEILQLNSTIGKYWDELITPVKKSLGKEMEIMAGKPKLVIAEK